jgi:hypothetical protein
MIPDDDPPVWALVLIFLGVIVVIAGIVFLVLPALGLAG